MLRIAYDVMLREFERVLLKVGLSAERAQICAQIFTQNSCDGVASHGYNRILDFARWIQQGKVDPNASAEQVNSFGAWEQWDGHLEPGMLNALACTDRVMELARAYGMGCVALRNTTHWMRPGTYGWKAAEAGFIFMCWTNTEPNVPPWGGIEPRIGNNPLVMAVPHTPAPIVLDIAMSQFSFGKTELYAHRGQTLPVPAGYDRDGNITQNPGEILATSRPLPIGFWKGSGLSLLLDLIATFLSGGLSTYQLGQQRQGVSQVYIAFDVARANSTATYSQIVTETLDFIKSATPLNPGEAVRYPGEQVLHTRQINREQGIPVDRAIWQQIQQF
jgi:3-dehydro-L-gulonate 2-dehydrogenase